MFDFILTEDLEKTAKRYGGPLFHPWRQAIIDREGGLCQWCKKPTTNCRVYHILGAKYYPHLKYDVDNGILLCWECADNPKHKKDFIMQQIIATRFNKIKENNEKYEEIHSVSGHP